MTSSFTAHIDRLDLAAPEKDVLKLIADRARTIAELAVQMRQPATAVRAHLVALERRSLVQLAEGQGKRDRNAYLWELHPLFLARVGAEPAFFRG